MKKNYEQIGENVKLKTKYPEWILYDEESNTWQCSECEMLWMFETGTPQSNEAYYCPRCGIRLNT